MHIQIIKTPIRMYLKRAVIILTFTCPIFLSIGCNSSEKQNIVTSETKPETSTQTAASNFTLANKLYLLGPEYNSTECEAYGECDCCSSNYLFLDNEYFVCVDYCLEGDTFLSGKYVINGDNVELKYNSTIVHKEYNWDKETDTLSTLPEFFFKTEEDKTFQRVWTKFNCAENINFKTTNAVVEYASMDKTQTAENFLATIKKEGILEKLNIQ
ncbi:MAG: hypothetical protein IPO14_10260 [Saprospiraceae bacterium]|nr:hypothetical protein [Saprospiraceae bacterium]